MRSLHLFAAIAVVALPLTAQAQRPVSRHARTAGELAELCSANPHEPGADAKLNYCHGFAQGVVDVELKHGKPFCWPSPAPSRTATLSQFVEWVRADASRRNGDAVDGLMHFLVERYPCK